MQTLSDILNADGKRPQVIADVITLIDQEVANKKGVTGFAIKQSYKAVSKLGGGVIRKAVDKMLDRFVTALDPFYQTFISGSQAAAFADFLNGQDNAVANALLGVTDSVRNGVDNKVLGKTYDSLRGSALKHVIDAVPGVGRLIQKHAFSS